MATIKTDLICNLNQPVAATFLHGNLFSQDNAGNTINVHVMENGEPATIGGTVSANVIRADGNTVAVSGAIDGNKAYVILPQACYAVPGRVEIIIKLTQNTTITTIAAIVANVYRSTTDTVVDPGTIIPSIQTLIAEIEEAVDSIPVDYSGLLATIAADYSSSKTYPVVGMYAWQGGVLKRNIVPITTAETYTAAHWTNAVIGDDLSALKSAIDALDDIVTVAFDYSSIPTDKLNISSSNKWNSNNNYSAYYFPIPEGAKTLTVKGNATNGSSIALLAASDTHTHGSTPVYATGWSKTFVNIGSEESYVIPSDAKYAWFLKVSNGVNFEPAFYGFNIDLDSVQTNVDLLKSWKSDVEDYLPSETELLSLGDLSTGKYIDTDVGSNWQNGYVTNSGSVYTANAIDVSQYDSIIVEIKSDDSHTGVRESGFCGSDNIVTSVIQEHSLSYKSDGTYARANIPVTDKYFFFSASSKAYLKIYGYTNGEIINSLGGVVFVSETGNDDGKGTYADPFATVNKALESGAGKIAVLGGRYFQTIDPTLTSKRTVEIVNYNPTKKAVFYSPNCVISESEESVSGYTKVYKATTTKTFNDNNVWIFQDGVADQSTLISEEERMPEQRGLVCRCLDTRIVKCAANTLADALTEIENASEFKWFIDGTDIYFSRPATVNANNPICGSFNTNMFSSTARTRTLLISGIDVKYMRFNINNTSHSVLSDCYCANAFGDGCFTFGGAVDATFIRCEASRAFYGTNGDGFNAHSSNTGDVFAKQTTATLIDCWSHDNRDDGISTHERSEFTVIGGLWEYNYYGGGITPANGAHCTCNGAYARFNGEGGFLYMNPASTAEGGVGGQMKCVDCVSESNNIWSSVTSAGYKINSAGNKGIMINCKAIGEDNGYYVSDNDGAMVLIDCGAYNCTTVKGGKTANITVKNTAIVN